MKIKAIVTQWLKANGCDGLYVDRSRDEPCGCDLTDFMPCGEPWTECEAARRGGDGLMYPIGRDGSNGGNWH